MLRKLDLAARTRKVATMPLTIALFASGPLSLMAQEVLKGVVKDERGEPLAGALVKAGSADLGISYMVVSQGQGRYVTPALRPGKYTVQAFSGSYQSAPAGPIEVGAKPAAMDLTLNVPLDIPSRPKRMNDEDYVKLLPEGSMKPIVADECAQCHSLLDVVSARKTRPQWRQTYQRMFDDMYDLRKLLVYHGSTNDAEPDMVADYLAKSFGPDKPPDPRVVKEWLIHAGGPSHPNRNLPAKPLEGAEAKYVSMEFSLSPGSTPHDIGVDSQGIAWISERNGGMLGRFDPASMSYTRIPVPLGKSAKLQLNAIAVDPQDQVWFADDGPNTRILRYDPKTQRFNSYPMPDYPYPVVDSGWGRIQTLRFRNGNVWGTGITSSRILRLDPHTGKMIDYPVPKGSAAFGMAMGGDNTIWYSTRITNVFVKLDPNSGRLTNEYPPLQDVAGGQARSDLRGLAADSEGNLWAAATETGKLLKLDYHTGYFTEYSPPTKDPGLYAVDVDTKRNLVWFSEIYSDKIGRFDPRTKSFVEFPLPSADSDVRRIEVDRSHPNRIWWAGNRRDKIGYIEVAE